VLFRVYLHMVGCNGIGCFLSWFVCSLVGWLSLFKIDFVLFSSFSGWCLCGWWAVAGWFVLSDNTSSSSFVSFSADVFYLLLVFVLQSSSLFGFPFCLLL